ncbi:hypothetical protein V1512DRAFT_259412 [Lipomyces arxii]|uniref:uncharacterized protein n=1 Tax=Lipomyces arxii TaxID=56418 RepID=UPI0034CDD2E3
MKPEENGSADYYSVLELVSPRCTADDIRKAYRRLALAYHPDKNPNRPEIGEKFKILVEANDILSDPQKRRVYDSAREAVMGRQWCHKTTTKTYTSTTYTNSTSSPSKNQYWTPPQDKYGSKAHGGYAYGSSRTFSFQSTFTPNRSAQSSPKKPQPSAYEYAGRNAANNSANTAKPTSATYTYANNKTYYHQANAELSSSKSKSESNQKASNENIHKGQSSFGADVRGKANYSASPTPTSQSTKPSPKTPIEIRTYLHPTSRRKPTTPTEPSAKTQPFTPTSTGRGYNQPAPLNQTAGDSNSSSETNTANGSGFKFERAAFEPIKNTASSPFQTPPDINFGVKSSTFQGANGDTADSIPVEETNAGSNSEHPMAEETPLDQTENLQNKFEDMWNTAFTETNPFTLNSPDMKYKMANRKKAQPKAASTAKKQDGPGSRQPTLEEEDNVSSGEEIPARTTVRSQPDGTTTPSPRKRATGRARSAIKSRAPLGTSSFDNMGVFNIVPPFTQQKGEFKMDELKEAYPINPNGLDVNDINMDSPRSPVEAPQEPVNVPLAGFYNGYNEPDMNLPFSRTAPIRPVQQIPTLQPLDFQDSPYVLEIRPPAAPIPLANPINPSAQEFMEYYQRVVTYEQMWFDYESNMEKYFTGRLNADRYNHKLIMSDSRYVDQYTRAIAQDEQVRSIWNEAARVRKAVMINYLASKRINEGW